MTQGRFAYDLSNCGIARALEALGEKWSLLILREAFYGLTRFDDFARALGCGRAVLSERLKTLVAAGVLEKASYRRPGERARADYRLTERGRDAFPILLALSQWADRWDPDPAGAIAAVSERASGRPVEIAMVSDPDLPRLQLRDLRIAPGPGARRIAEA